MEGLNIKVDPRTLAAGKSVIQMCIVTFEIQHGYEK